MAQHRVNSPGIKRSAKFNVIDRFSFRPRFKFLLVCALTEYEKTYARSHLRNIQKRTKPLRKPNIARIHANKPVIQTQSLHKQRIFYVLEKQLVNSIRNKENLSPRYAGLQFRNFPRRYRHHKIRSPIRLFCNMIEKETVRASWSETVHFVGNIRPYITNIQYKLSALAIGYFYSRIY